MSNPSYQNAAFLGMGTLLAVIIISCTITGCESGGSGGLEISPNNPTIGPNISSLILSVVGGTDELSYPLEWTVSDPSLGRIVGHSGSSALYSRTSVNGVNTVTAKDQYDIEGSVLITQVAYDTEQPTATATTDGTEGTTTTTATTTTTTQPAAPISVSVSEFVITVNNLFSDGSGNTTDTKPTVPGEGYPSEMFKSVSSGGETHQLSFSNIKYDLTTVTRFTLVVDGSTTISYP